MKVRRVTPIDGVNTAAIARPAGVAPELRRVDPATLLIDGAYQRDVGREGLKLIRQMVLDWDWNAFVPPACVDVDGALHVIDGQHTAIAAVTRGDIGELPVLVRAAPSLEARASAFVAMNTRRLRLTPGALFAGRVAAGEADAIALVKVLEAAGVSVARTTAFKAGETASVGTLRLLFARRGAPGLARVLKVVVGARCAPIIEAQLRAVDLVMHGGGAPIAAAELIAAFQRLTPEGAFAAAMKRAADTGERPVFAALAGVLVADVQAHASPSRATTRSKGA